MLLLLRLLGSATFVALAAPPAASVTSVFFVDLDLDGSELGGTVSWAAPGDTSQVLNYNVYLATDALGGGRASAGTVAVGTNQVSLPADTALGSFTYLVVMTANGDGEQGGAPGSVLLEDQVAVITSLLFNDRDLDIGHIGGRVEWQLGGSAPVTGYKIYAAESAQGLNRSLLGDVTIQQLDIVTDTTYDTNLYICVYPVSSLGESSRPPSAIQIYDVESPVRNLAFQDLDLDAGELGGRVSWLAPLDDTEVTQYVVTRSTSSTGAGRGPLGTALSGATGYTSSANLVIGSYTHISVYSRSSLAEASTPVSVPTVDAAASASDVTFQDTDLDMSELGGTVSWTAPANTTGVVGYALYMATSAWGRSRSNMIGADSLSLNRTLGANTNKASYTHFTVYTKSGFTEQSIPASATIADVFISTTFCNTFACPAGEIHRGNATLCGSGTCNAATCCYPGCGGAPALGEGYAAAGALCTDMATGGSCAVRCASGYAMSCPTGSICGRVTCSADGSHQWNGECVRWNVGSWGACSAACGSGTQTRSVECSSPMGGACFSPPPSSRSCSGSSTCFWLEGSWGRCSEFCGVSGLQTRSVQCSAGAVTCTGAGTMPATQRACRVEGCGCKDDGAHDPMRPWGRSSSLSCGAQWWLIFWIIIASCLLLVSCNAVLAFGNFKSGASENGECDYA